MEELKEKFKEYLSKGKPKYIKQICEDLGLEEYQVYGLLEVIKKEGSMYDVLEDKVIKVKPERSNEVYRIPNELDHMKLLLISDTHLCSKFDRLDILRYLYDKADKVGANYVLHCGDVTDGKSGRPQQEYELKELSYTGQRDYVVEKYPKSNIPTYMIAGNHDFWWIRQCGADIVKDICSKRDDLVYLGSDCEDLMLGKTRIRMKHSAKGTGNSYARSYKIQKYLDGIPLEERPDILQTGHTHNAFYMKQDKTHCFQTSCLQDLTSYERSMGFGNDKSCWWVDVFTDKNGKPERIQFELETFGKKLVRK